jgi:hypothetical protein
MRFSNHLLPSAAVAAALFSLTLVAGGCSGGGSGGGASGSGAGGGSVSSPNGPNGGGASIGGDRVMVANFENGQINPEFHFFKDGSINAGSYTQQVVDGGANGSGKALKFSVTHGAPYFYFDPFWSGNPRYLAEGKKVNRLGFWLKLPEGWGQSVNPWQNFHVGWYLSNDIDTNETNNGHFYHQMYLVPNSDWMYVVVGDDVTWQRGMADYEGGNTYDPGRGQHLNAFSDFFSKVTRFYITGAPNPGDVQFVPGGSYDMYIDEIEFFYEEDALETSPRVVKTGADVETTVTLRNTLREGATYQVKTSVRNGPGCTVLDEAGAAVTSIDLAPGGTRQVRVIPHGPGFSNIVFYPAGGPGRNPLVQNRTTNAGYRGFAGAGASILVNGQ